MTRLRRAAIVCTLSLASACAGGDVDVVGLAPPATGSLAIAVSGLPGGASAAIQVRGATGSTFAVSASTTLSSLAAGPYTVDASAVVAGGGSYAPAPASQTVTVVAGGTAAASVAYQPSTGSLALTITGLPSGTSAAVTVTGPAGFAQSVAGSGTLSGLAPGSYTILADAVVGSGVTYAPSPPSQSRAVVAGATAAAQVSYTDPGGQAGLNLRVDGVYLTQAVQRYDGAVPLVAGRGAYLRVFLVANQANLVAPVVRVRLYQGPTLVQAWNIAAPASSVPTAVDEGTLAASWNVLVPGALVQAGLRVLADVDPSGTVPEADETDNQWPAGGSPAPVDVRALPEFQVRFVPVLQEANGLQGNVSEANKEQFLADLKKLLPVGGYNADIRAPYTSTALALQSDNQNFAWGMVLSEVYALRQVDGSPRYYYGVVKTSYSSGVAGVGYIGGNTRTAIGWDRLPSGAGIMAHEVGHNMDRQHAPCGGPASPDPAYPYSGGVTGVWGLDLATLTLKSPSTNFDLMGYCNPDWVSDYNWSAMIAYRQAGPDNAPPAVTAAIGGLLVWGRITPEGVVLEPAFRVTAPATIPEPGSHRVELLDARGATISSTSFDAVDVADLPGGGGAERHFAFVLPLDAGSDRTLAGLRVHAAGRVVERRTAVMDPLAAVRGVSPSAAEPAAQLERADQERLAIRWDGSRYPMVMVRDAATGQVLSFARGGAATLWTRSDQVRLDFSDGVRSVGRQARAPR